VFINIIVTISVCFKICGISIINSIRFLTLSNLKMLSGFGSNRNIRVLILLEGGTRMVKNVTHSGERTAEESIRILWKIIEEAKAYMEDPILTSEEKRRWAKTLADTIGVLNKLLASQGEKQLEDEDLGTLLAKIPTTLRRTVMRRVHVWRRKNS
jgi:hypothetical protein